MAEGILRTRIAEAGLDATVSSAGVMQGGAPATPDAVATLADRDIDISTHRSRRLDHDLIAESDLIVTMTRDHLREVVVAEPTAFSRTFTLRELVRKLDATPGAPLTVLHAGRAISDYRGSEPNDDVADPIGKAKKVYVATADELDRLLTVLVKSLETL